MAAQEEEDVPDPENDDALAESVNARNGFQASPTDGSDFEEGGIKSPPPELEKLSV